MNSDMLPSSFGYIKGWRDEQDLTFITFITFISYTFHSEQNAISNKDPYGRCLCKFYASSRPNI